MTKFVRSRWADFMKFTPAILVAYALSISAFTLSYQANTRALHEAQARSVQIEAQNILIREQNARIEEQNQRMRYTFCGVFETFGNTGEPATTARGAQLQELFRNGAGADGLSCTPDLTDGR